MRILRYRIAAVTLALISNDLTTHTKELIRHTRQALHLAKKLVIKKWADLTNLFAEIPISERVSMRKFTNRFAYAFIIVAFLTVASLAKTANASDEDLLKCANLLNQATAARYAEDWAAGIRIGKKLDEICDQPYDLVPASLNSLNRHQEALMAAEKCIDRDYTVTGCHIEKAIALGGLGRISDEVKALKTASSVVKTEKDSTSRMLYIGNSFDRELAAAKMNVFARQEVQINLRLAIIGNSIP